MTTKQTTPNPITMANHLMDMATEAFDNGEDTRSAKLYDAAEKLIEMADGQTPETVDMDSVISIYSEATTVYVNGAQVSCLPIETITDPRYREQF